MKILLFLIALLVLFSCTKDKTPPKDECIEPYVGNYKVIEMRKADGTIIPEDKVRDSLQADHAWIDVKPWNQTSSPYEQIGWIYNFHWTLKDTNFTQTNKSIISCELFLTFDSATPNPLVYPLTVEFLPDSASFFKKNADYFEITNLKNSAKLKLIKL